MRLTKKSEKLGYCLRTSHFRVNQCWNKLGKLEDLMDKYKFISVEQMDEYIRLCNDYVSSHGAIEHELGIDLITLFKALENGIWVKYKRHFFDEEYTIEHYSPEDFVVCFQKDLSDNCEAMFFKVRIYGDFYDGDIGREIEGDFEDTIYLSKNYGKTWALTKEELL